MKKFILFGFSYLLISLFFLRGIIFSPGIIQGGDWSLPFTILQGKKYLLNILYTWDSSSFLGMPLFFLNGIPFRIFIFFLLNIIGVSGELYLKMIILFGFIFSAVSMYFLCRYFKVSSFISFLCGLIYITLPIFFNYYAIGWILIILVMSIIPLFLLFLFKSIEYRNIKYTIITGVLFFLSFIHSQSFIWLFFLMFFSLIIWWQKRKIFFENIFLISITFLLLNSYFILPLFISGESKNLQTNLVFSGPSLGSWARLSYINILRLWGSLFNYQFETAFPRFLIPFSFLIPFLAYSSFLFKKTGNKKRKKILIYLALLSFIPFFIFILKPSLIAKLPFSDVLRDIARFLVFSSFSYVIMLGFFLEFLFKKEKSKFVRAILIILILINGWPFWMNEISGGEKIKYNYDIRLRTYSFPKENYILEKMIKEEKNDIKVLYFPVGGILNIITDKNFYGPFKEIRDNFADYSWKPGALLLFSDKDVGLNNFLKDFLNQKIDILAFEDLLVFLRLTNTKYIAVREGTVYKNKIPAFIISDKLREEGRLVMLEKWPTISLFKNQSFLPHFYIPQNIIYSNGKIEDLINIFELLEYELRSGIYLENSKLKGLGILEKTDELLVIGELKNRQDKDYFEKLDNFKNNVPFPYVKHKPGNLMWKIAKIKENYDEWGVRKNSIKLIDKKLFFAGKRISEFKKFLDEADSEQITLIIKGWKKKIGEVVEEIEKIKNEEIKKEQIIKLRAYFDKHQEEIKKLKNLKFERFKKWEEAFGEVDKRIKEFEGKFDLNELEYKLEVPKKGEYTLYLKIPTFNFQFSNTFQKLDYKEKPAQETKKLEDWEIKEIEIDGEELEIENPKLNGEWLELGKINLSEGEHKLTLFLLEGIDLVGKNWQKLKEIETTEERVIFERQGFFPEAKDLVFQPIEEWEPQEFYYLSFEYKTKGGNLGVGLVEEKRVYEDEKEEIKKEKIFEKKLASWESEWERETWQKFERAFQADTEALGAEIYFYSEPEAGKIAKVEFRNVQVKRIREPKVILKGELQSSIFEPKIPKITFVKINPTKYRIKVEEAKSPYTLVFSESFHEGWKIYLKENQNPKLKIRKPKLENLGNLFMEKIGKIGEKVTDLFLDNQGFGEEVASYFDGEIKEGTHRMTFLEPATFETWGKKPIAEDRHYLVNGYANSWYITPEDVEGAENYELIVEFWPQRFFYIGLAISLTTLVGCLGYLGYDFILNFKNKNEKN